MASAPRKKSANNRSEMGMVYMAGSSLLMIVATFVVSNLDVALSTQYLALVPAAAVYVAVTAVIFRWQRRAASASAEGALGEVFDADVESKLAQLADANEFFGASLRPDDLFRLVASRMGEIVPFDAAVLYVRDEETRRLRVRCASGDNAKEFSSHPELLARGLANLLIEKGGVVRDPRLEAEMTAQPPAALAGLGSAIGAALSHEGGVYGALIIYSGAADDFAGDLETRFAAAAERISPLVAGSFAFERSVDNALTDPVTGLPNERGFFLVLESRIAESHRFKDSKGLAVLAMDIAGFSDFNETFGHAAGNRLLAHVAEVAKGELRQMDIITRSAGDEFLAILPTAGENVTAEIVERLRGAFEKNPFAMDHGTTFAVRVNFGSANFGRGGETAQSLLQMARTRKHEAKTKEGRVLFFPKETVN